MAGAAPLPQVKAAHARAERSAVVPDSAEVAVPPGNREPLAVHAPLLAVVAANGVYQPIGSGDRAAVQADQATMAAVAAGDAPALRRLLAEQSPPLLRFARSVLDAGGDEAEEVVQEALIRLWRNAHSWQPSGRIGTWLHRVAYRLCIDALRRRRQAIALDEVADLLPDPTPLPGTRLRRLEDVDTIRAAIASLPPRQRAALALCHFQGLNQADGASVMGVGEHAYESLLARARKNLRARLSNGRATP
jgi:RNA polymerase sigma-70 factor (ECF subfamily)